MHCPEYFSFRSIEDSYKPIIIKKCDSQENLPKMLHHDLVIFISDSHKKFANLFNQRTAQNNEFWLLHITSWNASLEAIRLLADHSHLNLNLKDDLYLYTRNKENIKIWEMYQIHPTTPAKVLPYGNWSDRGIELKKESKWQRRKDLTVNFE